MAIVLLGEGFAFACEGGAASVEAVGVVNSFAAGLNTGLLVCGGYEKGSRGGYGFAVPAYPARYYYARQGQGTGYGVSVSLSVGQHRYEEAYQPGRPPERCCRRGVESCLRRC